MFDKLDVDVKGAARVATDQGAIGVFASDSGQAAAFKQFKQLQERCCLVWSQKPVGHEHYARTAPVNFQHKCNEHFRMPLRQQGDVRLLLLH